MLVFRSMMVTSVPLRTAAIAVEAPAGPPPTMIMWLSFDKSNRSYWADFDANSAA